MLRFSNHMTTDTRLLHKGMSFGYLARRGYFSTKGFSEVEKMADMGIDWVALMVTVMQDAFHSTRVYQDFDFTATDHELARIIDKFHEYGINVMLKPMIECHDSSWRGLINFPSDGNQQIEGRATSYWQQWFSSFRNSVIHYAELAERTGCEYYCLGCELFAAEQAAHAEHWEKIIAATRASYAGLICYDAQPQTLMKAQDPPLWMKGLDAICVSYYTRVADGPGATVAEMVEAMKPSAARLRNVSETLGIPVIFGEAGCRSVSGGAINPAEYRTAGSYAPEEQAHYLEAMFQVFWNEPWWGGLYWWKWDEQQTRPQYTLDPAGDTGFTLQGKPAAEVMKKWFTSGISRDIPTLAVGAPQ